MRKGNDPQTQLFRSIASLPRCISNRHNRQAPALFDHTVSPLTNTTLPASPFLSNCSENLMVRLQRHRGLSATRQFQPSRPPIGLAGSRRGWELVARARRQARLPIHDTVGRLSVKVPTARRPRRPWPASQCRRRCGCFEFGRSGINRVGARTRRRTLSDRRETSSNRTFVQCKSVRPSPPRGQGTPLSKALTFHGSARLRGWSAGLRRGCNGNLQNFATAEAVRGDCVPLPFLFVVMTKVMTAIGRVATDNLKQRTSN